MRQLLCKNLIFLIIFVLAFSWTDFAFSDYGLIEATIKISICGDEIAEGPEECDPPGAVSDFRGKSCQDFGYTQGSLFCNLDCTIDASACYSPPAPRPPLPGGGGNVPPLTETKVVLSGRAYPGMKTTVLKDGQIAASTIADPVANFHVAVSGLSSGSYIFGVYSEDNQGRRSSLLTFPVSITPGVAINISGIFVVPTIDLDKREVKHGDAIAIFGQAAAEAEITINISSEEELFFKTRTDKNGIYLYNFDTVPLSMGQHFTKSRAALAGEISSYSKIIGFLVGMKNVLKERVEVLIGDLNNDGRVNLVDFSIAAYWYKRPNPPAAVDLNSDGKVDLVDFSIMAYYWTG